MNEAPINESHAMALVSTELIAIILWLLIYIPKILGECSILSNIVAPLSLAFPFVVLYLVNFHRFVKAHIDFSMKIRGLSPVFIIFYIINTVVFFGIVLLPLLAPVLLLILSIEIPYRVSQHFERVGFLIFLGLLLLFLPFTYYLFVVVYAKVLVENLATMIFTFLLLSPRAYMISIGFAAAVSIGSFIKFMYEGAQVVDPTVKIPTRRIYILEFLLTVVFLYCILVFPWTLNILVWFLALYVFESFLRKIKGLRPRGVGGSTFLFFIVVLFETLRRIPYIWEEISRIFRLSSETLIEKIMAMFMSFQSLFVLLTTIIFLISFAASLLGAENERK